ncbi:MAG: hypothetical protein COA78_04345 [Blastopirellula sp.]|nr:MAG: hypothetical protein COA78_04345 [Blastopirellula sp.]
MSLKYLFGITAFCAVIAWCASQYGYSSIPFWITLALSLAISGVFVILARNEKTKRYSYLAPLPLIFFCIIPIASFSQILNLVLLVTFSGYLAARPVFATKDLCAFMMVFCGVSQVLGTLPGRAEVKDLMAMRAAYPIVSLEDRLAYENQVTAIQSDEPLSLSAEVLLQLTDVESNSDGHSRRTYDLKRIHSEQYEQFVRSAGFGVSRMRRPYMGSLTLPPIQNITFNHITDPEAESVYPYWDAMFQLSASSNIDDLHQISQIDFLDPDGYGAFFEKENKVAGFTEHSFHYSPREGMDEPGHWKIDRLELVSLLKFSEPQVYVLDHLPRMDQLKADKVPTRALNEFELGALDQLWTEQDLVISNNKNHYQMLGSLRAAKKCLECHQVERGTLLGAFTYHIQHLPPEDIDKN